MWSSQLALHGLVAIEEGNPYITALISQEETIEKFKSIPRFKEIWDKALGIAQTLIPEDKQGVSHIQLIYVCFVSNTVQLIGDDFNFSAINSHTILHTNHISETAQVTSPLIKAEVNIVLFS